MPIRRTFQCPECFHRIELELDAEQWDAPAPQCPRCEAWDREQSNRAATATQMEQEFKPFAINGSPRAKAAEIAEDIITKDYHVQNWQTDRHEGARPKVTYKDQTHTVAPSSWTSLGREAIEGAMVTGRQTRLEFGTGLDVLQSNLKSGAQPDLIEVSKRRSARIW